MRAQAAVVRQDGPALRRLAHTLKGSASTASAHGVAKAARAIEALAAEGRIDALEEAWADLSKEATQLLQSPPTWATSSSSETSCEP